MLTLWSMPSSGNSYKVRLLLAHLGLPFHHVSAEHGSNVTRSAAFLALNPAGKVPLLVLEDGRTLRESNAILLYLGRDSRFVPHNAYDRALCHQWMFFEQYNHEPSVAVRIAILTYPDLADRRRPEILDPLLEKGHAAMTLMETQLSQTPFIAGETFTVADMCLYAYTHRAGDKGGFDMQRFPAINAWLERVASEPGHVALDWLPPDKDANKAGT